MAKKVKLDTTRSKITEVGKAWVITMPRFGEEGSHFHTFGLLTPYFKGLGEGKLMATRCTNPDCPIGKGKGEMWLPPRADCPDCHQPMKWREIKNPKGYIYAYTYVERGGAGLEIEPPYYQIDVKLKGVGTIFKGYLRDRKPIEIGDKVQAVFRKGNRATRTSLDIAWELI